MPPIDDTVLSASDVKHFEEQGYVIVRNAVPPELVRDALRSINYQLGQPNCWEPDPNPLNAAQLSLKLPQDGIGCDMTSQMSSQVRSITLTAWARTSSAPSPFSAVLLCLIRCGPTWAIYMSSLDL